MAQARPVQEPLVGNEVTKPTLDELRALFLNRIAEFSSTEGDLKLWLQSNDNGCEPRAEKVSKILRPKDSQTMPPQTTIAKVTDWAMIKKSLDRNVPVRVKNRDKFIGGEVSTFGGSHHVVLFVAYGNEGGEEGPAYFIGYDPDVTATAATRDAWQALGGRIPGIPQGLDATQLHDFISEMILPNSMLGTLFRKYYVDLSKPFPKYDPLEGLH